MSQLNPNDPMPNETLVDKMAKNPPDTYPVLSDRQQAALDARSELKRKELFRLTLKLKTARMKKERTAKALQDVWDADNKAGETVADLEAKIATLESGKAE